MMNGLSMVVQNDKNSSDPCGTIYRTVMCIVHYN